MKPRLIPFNVAPQIMQAFVDFSMEMAKQGVEKSLAELVKIRASQLNHCAFCLHMHTREALAAGESKYFTGRPCRNGHVAFRLTLSGVCYECYRAYQTRPEVAAANSKSASTWDRNNPEAARARQQRWKKENPEAARLYSRRWHQAHLEQSREIKRQAARRTRTERPELKRAYEGARRARKRSATPPWAELEAIKEFYARCPEGCEVDHIIPLTNDLVCGLHVLANLQYLPARENSRKKNNFKPFST